MQPYVWHFLICDREQGNNILNLVNNITTTAPKMPAASLGISRNLKTLIFTLLAKEPKYRPSVNQLLRSSYVRGHIKTLVARAEASGKSSSTSGGVETSGMPSARKPSKELTSPQTSPIHPHPLQHRVPYPGKKWKCDVCKKKQAVDCKAWNCQSCGYDLCTDCLTKSSSRSLEPSDPKSSKKVVTRPRRKKKYICKKCKVAFKPKERYVTAEGQDFHPGCLCCDGCGQSIQNGYILAGVLPLFCCVSGLFLICSLQSLTIFS